MVLRKQLKKIKIDIVYIVIRCIVRFFRILPRRVALSIGSVLGRMIPYFARKELKLAVRHLTIAFGNEKDEKEILRLARETFRQMAVNFVDTVRLRIMSHDDVIKACVPHHIDRLHDAMKKGHGVIMLGSHTGCWELLGAYLVATGFPVSAIVRRLYDPRLEDMLIETREYAGINVISRGEGTRDIVGYY